MRGADVRNACALALAGVCLLALPGCESMQHHSFIWIQEVNGTPYLVVGNNELSTDRSPRFAIYRPAGMGYTDWTSVAGERLGSVYGTFAYADETGESLGLIHQGQLSVLRFPRDTIKTAEPTEPTEPAEPEEQPDDDPADAPDTKDKKDTPATQKGSGAKLANVPASTDPVTTFHALRFNWLAETGAQLGAYVYLFGSDITPVLRPADPQARQQSPMRLARFDGETVEELTLEGPPPMVVTNARGFYWMRALPHGGKLHVFWRGAEIYGGLDIEPPVTMQGPLRHAVFDGEAFENTVRSYDNLPDGTTVVWSDRGQLHVAVQPQDPTWGKSPSPLMYTLPAEGNMLLETAMDPRPRQKGLRFKFFDIERIPDGDAAIFLRSNGQRFEIWEADGRQWSVITQPHGLPGHDLESALMGVLAVCLFLVALGLGMAFRRRRQVLLVMEKLRAQDVLAPLSLRISAYLIDLALTVVITDLILRGAGQTPARWTNLIHSFVANPVFLGVYVVYLSAMETYLGASVGKFLLGLRVISVHGDRPSLWASFVRNLVGFYERHFIVAVFAAMPTILLTPRRQRLGDLLGHTLVVQKAAMDKYKSQREVELAKRWRLDGTPAPEAGAVEARAGQGEAEAPADPRDDDDTDGERRPPEQKP